VILRWIRFSPLLFLIAHPCPAQTTATVPAPDSDSICLSEILISTPQPYDTAQLADAEHKAQSAREAIRQGAKFEDIAKKYSDGPSAIDGGALGAFKRGQLPKQIEDKVFVMKVGDVSDVIRTKQGFAVLQVTECSRPIGGQGKLGTLYILSNTQGVDFGPYLTKLLHDVRENWYRLIPQSVSTRTGQVAIEFSIKKDGTVASMKLVATSGDAKLDRAAWGGITSSIPFSALPSEFTGPYLALRLRFQYNPDKGKLD
jgi:TonB family protein